MAGGGGGSAPTTMTAKDLLTAAADEKRSSPLVRMKHVQSEGTIRVRGSENGATESEEKWEGGGGERGREERPPVEQNLKRVREMGGNVDRGDTDLSVMRLTPVEDNGLVEREREEREEREEGKEIGERGEQDGVGGVGEEEEEEEGAEGEEGMTTEDDETEDDELDDEEEEEDDEEEEEGGDSISPTKEILINVVSARCGVPSCVCVCVCLSVSLLFLFHSLSLCSMRRGSPTSPPPPPPPPHDITAFLFSVLSTGTRPKNPVSSSVQAEGGGGGGGGGGTGDDTVSVSSVMTTQSMEDGAGMLSSKQALHKAVLEIVYSLSSDVSLKKNSQGLNQ